MNFLKFLKIIHFKFSKLSKAFSWAVILMIGTMSTGAHGQVLIEDDFETAEGFTTGVLDSQFGWTSSGAVVVDTTSPYSGTQMVWLPLDEINDLTKSTSSTIAGSTVYLDFHLSPNAASSFSELPTDFSHAAAALTGIVNTGSDFGEFYVVYGNGFGGGTWQSTGTFVPLTGNAVSSYLWYVYELDYATKAYNFFLDGVLIANSVPFLNSSTTQFTQLKLGSDGKDDVYFDDFTVSYDAPAGLDHDGDGLFTSAEDSNGNGTVEAGETDFMSTDTDSDTIDDLYEVTYGLNPLLDDSDRDADLDTLSNLLEYQLGSNINSTDSDSDTYGDFEEYLAGTSLTDGSNLPESRSYGDWDFSDINQSVPGYVFTVDGSALVSSAGLGFGYTTDDQLSFLHKTVKGDFSLTLRIKDFVMDEIDSSIAIMARSSLAPKAQAISFAAAGDSSELRYRIYNRPTDLAISTSVWLFAPRTAPYPNRYLKLVKTGNVFTLFVSRDGSSFEEIGTRTNDFTGSFELGIAVDSESSNLRVCGTFDVAELKVDSDQDKLWDDQELLLGTNPLLADSDGDGYDDYTEARELFSDPTVADLSITVSSEPPVDGSAYASATGSWGTENGEVYSIDSVGSLGYTLNVPSTDSYRLRVSLSDNNAYNVSGSLFELKASLNGVSHGVNLVPAPHGQITDTYYYLPQLVTGSYDLQLKWLNGNRDSRLRVHSVQLERLDGPDTDLNGTADWLDHRLSQTAGIETLPTKIFTSPYCLEGDSYSVSALQVVSTPQNDPSNVRQESAYGTIDYGFYADIALDPNQARTVKITEQSGLQETELDITWDTFNLFENQNIDIRLNDSLLLSAFDPSDTNVYSIQIDLTDPGGTLESHTIQNDSRLQTLFDEAGTWLVEVSFPQAAGAHLELSADVNVFAANLKPDPIVSDGLSRTWKPYVSGDTVEFSWSGGLSLIENLNATGGREFTLSASDDGQSIIARLPKTGSILSVAAPFLMRDQTRTQTSNQIVETFADGTVMVRAYILLAEVPDDLEITIDLFKSGVIFDDGTILRTITAADFDETGRYQFFLLRSPGVLGGNCHRLTYMQGTDVISLQ